MEIDDELQRRADPRRDRVTAAERRFAKEQVKHGLLLGTPQLPIAIGHGQLVQVGEECEILGFQTVHRASSYSVLSTLSSRRQQLTEKKLRLPHVNPLHIRNCR